MKQKLRKDVLKTLQKFFIGMQHNAEKRIRNKRRTRIKNRVGETIRLRNP